MAVAGKNAFFCFVRDSFYHYILCSVMIQHHETFSLTSRLANAFVSFVTYLEKTFWPHDMAVFYPFPIKFQYGRFGVPSLLIIFISAAVIAMVKRLPYLFVGWLWYAITIAPVIGIIQVRRPSDGRPISYLPLSALPLCWLGEFRFCSHAKK